MSSFRMPAPKAGTGALLNQEQQSELVKMFA
jgi:hypothetical protein